MGVTAGQSAEQVVAYIDAMTSTTDFQAIAHALERAQLRLEAERVTAVDVDVDQFVTIDGVLPSYLNGLQGEVVHIDGAQASIELTPESTGALRFCASNDRYPVAGLERYVVPGVPLACCHPSSAARPTRRPAPAPPRQPRGQLYAV